MKEIKDYVCFDIETTGFGKSAEIIEFGAVKVRDNEIIDTYSELVKPIRRIPPIITEITGITQNDVENCRGISEVLPEFLQFIGEDILVGHNIASFDIPVIRQAIHIENEGSKFEPFYVDTMYLARKIDGIINSKLQTVLLYYGIKNERAHRAFQDCEANHKLFQAMKSDGLKPYVRHSIEYVYGEKPEPAPKEHLEISISEEIPENLSGKRIVLTGEFGSDNRENIKKALVSAGALIRSVVSKNIDYLIVGSYGSGNWKYDNGGSKIKTAQELGVTIIPEKAVMSIIKSNTEVKNV